MLKYILPSSLSVLYKMTLKVGELTRSIKVCKCNPVKSYTGVTVLVLLSHMSWIDGLHE